MCLILNLADRIIQSLISLLRDLGKDGEFTHSPRSLLIVDGSWKLWGLGSHRMGVFLEVQGI